MKKTVEERLRALLKGKNRKIRNLEQMFALTIADLENHDKKIRELETALRVIRKIDFTDHLEIFSHLVDELQVLDPVAQEKGFQSFIRLFEKIPFSMIRIEHPETETYEDYDRVGALRRQRIITVKFSLPTKY